MSSSFNAAGGPGDAPAAALDGPARPSRVFDASALRPAPANWRGCGYRRTRTTQNGGRAEARPPQREARDSL